MTRLSKHFTDSEFACPCCGLNRISTGIITIAEIIRHFEGDKPLTPNSACRCLEHNERVQKDVNKNYKPFSSKSMHLPKDRDGIIDEENGTCIAADFGSDEPFRLYSFMDSLFPDTYGIGVYSWGIHIDIRKEKARW